MENTCIRFDEMMTTDFVWEDNDSDSEEWDNVEFLGEYGNYFLYWCWDNYEKKQEGTLFRIKKTDNNYNNSLPEEVILNGVRYIKN